MNEKINERITAYRIRLISETGENKGEVLKTAALEIAKKAGLDLVEVSSGAIPVCRIMNFGKIKYEKAKLDKHKTHAPTMKEIRIKYNTDKHDIEIKKRKIQEFLADGHKVLFSMQIKGRERYVASGVAKDKFLDIVHSMDPDINRNEITENSGGYSVTIHPHN